MNATPFEILPDQEYIEAPVEESVIAVPAHITEAEAVIEIVGDCDTLMICEAVLLHPYIVVPVTVYVEVDVGKNGMLSLIPPVHA